MLLLSPSVIFREMKVQSVVWLQQYSEYVSSLHFSSHRSHSRNISSRGLSCMQAVHAHRVARGGSSVPQFTNQDDEMLDGSFRIRRADGGHYRWTGLMQLHAHSTLTDTTTQLLRKTPACHQYFYFEAEETGELRSLNETSRRLCRKIIVSTIMTLGRDNTVIWNVDIARLRQADYRGWYSDFLMNGIVNGIYYFYYLLLWVWCNILSHNVPPTTPSDWSHVTVNTL